MSAQPTQQIQQAVENQIQRRGNDQRVEQTPDPHAIRTVILQAMAQSEQELVQRARHLSYLQSQLAVINKRIEEEQA